MHIEIKMYEALTDSEGLQYFGVITVDGVTDFYAEDTEKDMKDKVARRVASEIAPGDTVDYDGKEYLVELTPKFGIAFKRLDDE